MILKSTYLWFQIGKYLRMVYNFSIEMELFRNMGQPLALFRLFSVFSNNFYNKFMWKNVHPVYGDSKTVFALIGYLLFVVCFYPFVWRDNSAPLMKRDNYQFRILILPFSRLQCDRMARLFVQHLAIYNDENLPKPKMFAKY